MKDFIIENGILLKYTGTENDVVIPDGVTSIGKAAFFQCSCLKNITIGENVKNIGDDAFKACSSLENIIIPNGVTSIGHESFLGCKNVRSIVISDTVTDIGVLAFGLCNALQNLTIGNGIKNISKTAFPSKMNLHKFVLAPDSEDETKNKLLLNAIGIEKLARPFLLDALETNGYILKKLKSQIISKRFREEFTPKLIKQNESTAFVKLLSLIKKMPSEEIDSYIEKSQDAVEIRNLLLEYKNRLYPTTCLDKMGEIQTEKDLGLQEKSLADYRKDFKIIKDGDTYKITGYKGEGEIAVIPASIKGSSVLIADKAFENCYRLREIFIENGVKSIGNNAFRNCINLSCITIPDSVTSIGDEAFVGCNSLETITLPNGINSISNYLFFGCSKLQSVIIPQSVTKIGYYAFRFCEKLQFVSIPDSVTEINDSHPFYKCGGKAIILCSIDSYAHQYAQQNGIPFKTE